MLDGGCRLLSIQRIGEIMPSSAVELPYCRTHGNGVGEVSKPSV
jgi:hypothetical protein